MIRMKLKDAIKLDSVRLDKTYLEENVLLEEVFYKDLYQHGDQKRHATDLKIHTG